MAPMLFTVVRVLGTVVGILGIALVRREQENAADLARPIRPRLVALCIVVAVIGGAAAVWSILAS